MARKFDMEATVGMKYKISLFLINRSYYQGSIDVLFTNQLTEVNPNTFQANLHVQFGLGALLFFTTGTE